MSREHFNTWTRVRAVLSSPSLYELAMALEWEPPVGRPRINPDYVTLGYGVLARILRSGIRVELDLAEPHAWAAARHIMIETINAHGYELPPPSDRPPLWGHWRYMRNAYLATDDGIGLLGRIFPPIAVAAARRIGQLEISSRGSLTHPEASRCVYGDGTLVRPIYRPPETVELANDDGTTTIAYPDPHTGQLLSHPPGRFDPDLQRHHGQRGPVLTHGYVAWHTRSTRPYTRIDLAMCHIPKPGAEADTAVHLLADVHRAAGQGVQVAIYDGALRGVHINEIMTRFGYLVLAKQHTDAASGLATEALAGTTLVQTPEGRRARSYPLGTVTHQLPTGPCHHQLAAAGGHVVEIDLDERGDPVIVGHLTRTQVKRARRAHGEYHFNVGYLLKCPTEPFLVWLSPHPGRDGDVGRPEQLRILPTGDPDAQRLYGLRSDAESFHSGYKRTLIVDRAMSLGWRRGLVDLYAYSLYTNALTEYRQRILDEQTTTVANRAVGEPRPTPGRPSPYPRLAGPPGGY